MDNDRFEEFSKVLADNYKTISFKDNQKGIDCSITKEKSGKYILQISSERTINSNDNINSLFNDMEKFIDSINERDYWPKTTEYEDLPIMWSTYKTGEDKEEKNGALNYPDGWDKMLDRIKDFLQ